MSSKIIPDHVPEQIIDEEDGDQPASLANVRHTLRTPLNHIIGYSEMLLEEASERGLEAFTADLQKIHKYWFSELRSTGPKRPRQLSEITNTEYFQDLQKRAKGPCDRSKT
jgi:signal transduction histidine kinase